MSDKETAPRICVVCGKECHHEGRKCSCIAAECTAPAPQPDAEKIRLLLIRAVMEMSYMHCAEVLSLVRSSEGESIIEEGMKLLGLKDLSEEELARVRAARPQVTPWKSHFTDSDVTGDIHNYVDTGDGKRLWAQDADEIVKRHNEQALQVTPELELEQEVDGRWIAELLGIAAYGKSREEAIRNAAKVLIESEPASPDLMAVIERLANHGSVDDYTVAGIRAELRDALHNSKREPSSPYEKAWPIIRRALGLPEYHPDGSDILPRIEELKAKSEPASPTPEQFPSRSQEKRIRTMRGDKNPLDPKASPTPERCPRCRSKFPGSYLWECWPEADNVPDSWHSSAATPKGSK